MGLVRRTPSARRGVFLGCQRLQRLVASRPATRYEQSPRRSEAGLPDARTTGGRGGSGVHHQRPAARRQGRCNAPAGGRTALRKIPQKQNDSRPLGRWKSRPLWPDIREFAGKALRTVRPHLRPVAGSAHQRQPRFAPARRRRQAAELRRCPADAVRGQSAGGKPRARVSVGRKGPAGKGFSWQRVSDVALVGD